MKFLCNNPIYSIKQYAINRSFLLGVGEHLVWNFRLLYNKTIYVIKWYAINRFHLSYFEYFSCNNKHFQKIYKTMVCIAMPIRFFHYAISIDMNKISGKIVQERWVI